jgi:hypothetical protein
MGREGWLMNLKESYIYMYGLLKCYFSFNKNNELAPVLAGFTPHPSASDHIISDDPAAWHDWINAVKKVTEKQSITEEEAKKAMIILLREYNDHHGFILSDVIKHFEIPTAK